MASAPKYQVFISSTYEDLKDERDQVIKAVLEMGHIPVGMEMFSAADEEQWAIIARHIEESDYYAVIVAHRVGSLASGGISYTRKEYEYAISKGVPVLGFVLEDTAMWPNDRNESTDSGIAALASFKTLIKQKPVSFWTSADDLYARFTVALGKAFTANPREGWIRSSDASVPSDVSAEIIRLSSENAKLRGQLEDERAASGADKNDVIYRTLQTLLATKRTPSYRYERTGKWYSDSEVSLFRVFRTLGAEMIVESSVREMANTLAMNVRKDKSHSKWDVVAFNQLRNLLADLMTLDLVQPSTRRHAVSDNEEYWSLSTFGNDVLKATLKLSLSDTTDTSVPSDESSDDSGPGGDSSPTVDAGTPDR
jgi:hypothetical protein